MPRSSTCAGCARWTSRPSAPRSGKTGRLVIAEEQWHEGGWGATLISELAMAGMAVEGAARERVACPTTCSSPTRPPLEDEMLPSAERIAAAARASRPGVRR